MSLPKPKCPQHNGSEGVSRVGNKYYCTQCDIYFITASTGGAQRSNSIRAEVKHFSQKNCISADGRRCKRSGKSPIKMGVRTTKELREYMAVYKTRKSNVSNMTISEKNSHSLVSASGVINIFKAQKKTAKVKTSRSWKQSKY